MARISEKRMRHAVAYYRVSTSKQAQSGLGLSAQKRAVHQYILANGIRLKKQYRETETGKHGNRPVLGRALGYCKKHHALLIIARLDRLGRNVAFISALMESGVEFVAVDNPHANKFMLHVLAAFAEHERELISSRTRQALAAAKKRGVKLGAPAHKRRGTNRKNADRFAQKLSSLIVKLKSENFITIRAIAEELNRRKVRTFYGGSKQWHRTTVYNLLKRIKHLNRINPS